MRFLCLALALLLGGGWAFGAPIKYDTLQVGPVTYSNVTILGANATDLYFTHRYGIGNVKLKYLSPELQKRFHYDAKAAAAAERQRTEDDARYQRELAATMVEHSSAESTNEAAAAASLADPVSDKSLLGKPAPALQVDKWLSAKPVTDGKFQLISFWAAESPASRQWIPELDDLQKSFTNSLVVIGVSPDSEEAVTNLTSPKIEFASALDPQNRLRSAAGVTSIPTVMLIDPKGVVRYLGHPAALSRAVMQQLLPKVAETSPPK